LKQQKKGVDYPPVLFFEQKRGYLKFLKLNTLLEKIPGIQERIAYREKVVYKS